MPLKTEKTNIYFLCKVVLFNLDRFANGGQNPQYGNPGSKPPFWPDFYWPWDRLTDVHTKPRGMEEPLQYSEMMKLAIGNAHQENNLKTASRQSLLINLGDKRNQCCGFGSDHRTVQNIVLTSFFFEEVDNGARRQFVFMLRFPKRLTDF